MKTLIANFVLFITVLISFSGCMDFEFPDMSGLGGFGSGYPSGYYPPYMATFYVDSIDQISDSAIIIWSHIQYDSILIIKNLKVQYAETSGVGDIVTESVQSESDTLDFRGISESIIGWNDRTEWIYKYEIEVKGLKNNVDYNVCILQDYSEKGIVKSIQQCMLVRVE